MKPNTTPRRWPAFRAALLAGPIDTTKPELDKHWPRMAALGPFVYQWHIIPSRAAAGVYRLALQPPEGIDATDAAAVRELLFTPAEVGQALDERTHAAVFHAVVKPRRARTAGAAATKAKGDATARAIQRAYRKLRAEHPAGKKEWLQRLIADRHPRKRGFKMRNIKTHTKGLK